MNSIDLATKLYDADFSADAVDILDSEYMIPARDYILKDFAGALAALKHQLGVSRYVKNSNDCDKSSRLAAWYFSHLHFLTSGNTQSGVAFGTMQYLATGLGWHMINIAVTDKGILYFEPQDCTERKLTQTEIFSCKRVSI